ncbi:MAG: XTP/dITP diphosphatase [Clostridia bacterium]|nr:XTP/dITP diphosphatase [Clostridia bacterium]
MRKFIAATKNKGKLIEIKEILNGFPFNVISMEDAGIYEDVDETGSSFEENALIKARAVFAKTGELVMADDSGLEVDWLNGGPGIYSARYAGEGATARERNDKLLRSLEGVPFEKRTARFVCVIAVIIPHSAYFTVRGVCEGYIGFEPLGSNGFGYDPLFYIPEYDMTVAQMEAAVKNRISHRGKALKLMVEKLKAEQLF